MKNSTENEQMPEQPPPYTVENTGPIYNIHNSAIPAVRPVYPNWESFGSTNTSNVFSSPLDLFIHTLGRNETFTLVPTGRLGCMNKTIIVQIRDTAQRPIVSVMTIPGQNVPTGGPNNNNSIRIGSIIQMTNSSGQTLLTGQENGQSITVSSGQQVLGHIEGLMFSSNFSVHSIMGEPLFQSVKGREMNVNSSDGCCSSSSSVFTLVSNGVPLACVEKSKETSGNCEITLFNSQNSDPRTKALLMFTGYLIYYTFMAETPFGNIGARGLCKRLCMCFCIFFLVITILFITIPIVVVTNWD